MPASDPRHPFDTDEPLPFGPESDRSPLPYRAPSTRSVPPSELHDSVTAGLSAVTAQQFWDTGIQLTAEIGRGGMGVVYQAVQVALNRHVAVKMLPRGQFTDAETLSRFQAEAQIIAQLQHPNIVQIHNVGELDGRPYIVLEYAAGGNLASRLAGRPLPPGPAASITAVLALAAHHAHSKGVVHRDIKMENILLTEDGRPKLTDFGLAKWATGPGVNSIPGSIIGSPAYMSPEQAEGRTADIGPKTDIYSLGIVLYQMLTGRVPFNGDSLVAVISQICLQPPPPPSRHRPDVPPRLEAICLKCLEKDPKDRYPTAFDLAADLKAFLASPDAQSGNRPPAPRRKTPVGLWLGIGVVAVGGLAAAGWFALRPGDDTGPVTKPAPPPTSAPAPPATKPDPVVLVADARKHLGQTVTIAMTVESTGQSTDERLTFLNSERPYSNPGNLAVVIDAKYLPDFAAKAGIPDVRAYFDGKHIHVTGKVTEYKKTGSFQVFVTSPSQIRVVK